MFGSFVLAVSSIAAALLPFPGVSTHARGAAGVYPLRLDRLSITKRIIEAHSRLTPVKNALKPSVLPQALHYRSIRMVKCPVSCYASDINNLGQISILRLFVTPPQAPGVVDGNNGFQSLSGLLSNDRPYSSAEAVALNDYGGVAGNYEKDIPFSKAFKGNLAWQLQNGVYKSLYFDGRENDAEALAINDYDITVGDSSSYPDGTSTPLPEVFSQFIPRHVLLGLNESRCAGAFGIATGINDANTIVGYYGTCEGTQAVRFSPYGYAKTFLPPNLSRENSTATAVNQNDDIVGSTDSGPYLYQAASNHTMLLPPRPKWDSVAAFYALSLNSSDQVIGDYAEQKPPYFYTGWLYRGGTTYDLNAILPTNSGWLIHTAIAINNAGQIIGQGNYTDPASGVVYANAVFVMAP